MYIQRRWWIAIFVVLFCADTVMFSLFILRRPIMTQEQWAFLEKQRPKITKTASGIRSEFFLCADCLDFALARRPIGGWDPPAQLVEIVNLPSSLLARSVFQSRQLEGVGSSKGNSDLATLIFAGGAVLEWALIATVFSVRIRRRSEA